MPESVRITITQIQRQLGVTRRRVLFAVEKLIKKRRIRPRFYGNTRTFTVQEAERIYAEIESAKRAGCPPPMLVPPERREAK